MEYQGVGRVFPVEECADEVEGAEVDGFGEEVDEALGLWASGEEADCEEGRARHQWVPFGKVEEAEVEVLAR